MITLQITPDSKLVPFAGQKVKLHNVLSILDEAARAGRRLGKHYCRV